MKACGDPKPLFSHRTHPKNSGHFLTSGTSSMFFCLLWPLNWRCFRNQIDHSRRSQVQQLRSLWCRTGCNSTILSNSKLHHFYAFTFWHLLRLSSTLLFFFLRWGECFAPSQAVLKPLEQPELQVKFSRWKWCEALSCGGPDSQKRGSNRI